MRAISASTTFIAFSLSAASFRRSRQRTTATIHASNAVEAIFVVYMYPHMFRRSHQSSKVRPALRSTARGSGGAGSGAGGASA